MAEPTEALLEDVPILAVRDVILYPGAMLPITIGRPSSVALVQSMGENRALAIVSQLDPRVDAPQPKDLYEIGTLCVMHKAIRVPRDNLLLFCEGTARIRMREFTADRAVPAGADRKAGRKSIPPSRPKSKRCGRTW